MRERATGKVKKTQLPLLHEGGVSPCLAVSHQRVAIFVALRQEARQKIVAVLVIGVTTALPDHLGREILQDLD